MPTTDRRVVHLGSESEGVDRLIAKGRFASESEVLRAGVRALEREEAAFDDGLRDKISKAMSDSRPNVSADEVFTRLRSRQEKRLGERDR